MTEDDPRTPDPEGESADPRPSTRPELTRWKVVLLGFAAVFLVVGGSLQAFAGQDDSAQRADPPIASADGTSSGPAPNAFTSGTGGGDTPIPGLPKWDPDPEEGSEDEDEVGAEPGAAGWSPFFLKGGFSFFVAFCVGYAMRTWLKVAALILGTFFLGVFLLSYTGAVDVDWITLEGWWNAFAERVKDEAVDFKTFLTGSLPQAGLAGLGLLTGFKRR